MLKVIKLLIVSTLLLSCDKSNNKQKELELKEKELELKERELSLKENKALRNLTNTDNSEDAIDSNIISNPHLANIFNIGVPITYKKLKSILGKETKVVKEEWATDESTYEVFIWELTDGAILELDEAFEGGILLSAKDQKVVKTPLNISINQSTLNQCKLQFKNLQKGKSYNNLIRWKYKNRNTWFYLEFDKKNILKRVWLLPWDAESTE